MEHSILSGMSSTNLSPQDSGLKDLERLLAPEEMDNTKETEPSRHDEADVHELTEPVAALIGPTHIHAR